MYLRSPSVCSPSSTVSGISKRKSAATATVCAEARCGAALAGVGGGAGVPVCGAGSSGFGFGGGCGSLLPSIARMSDTVTAPSQIPRAMRFAAVV